MQLKNSIEEHKKQCWLEFRLNKEFLMAYTIVDTFEGELEATLESLAHDNNCDISDIKYKRIYK